jgi:hypothetical protein
MAPLVFGIANCFDQKPGKKNNKFLFALSRAAGVSSARRYQAKKKFLSLLTTQNISTEKPLEKINKLPLLGLIAPTRLPNAVSDDSGFRDHCCRSLIVR